jgi:hypothetical protein
LAGKVKETNKLNMHALNKNKKSLKAKIISILLFHIVLNSAYSQKDYTNFENLNKKINVKDFFLVNFVDKDSTKYLLPGENNIYKTINAKETFSKYYETRYVSMKNIYANELNNQINYTDDAEKIIGKVFSLNRYTEDDTSYFYKNLRFNHFQMMSDTNNLLLAVICYNSEEKETSYEKLLSELKLKFHFSVKEDDRKISTIFQLKNYLLIINKIKTSYNSESSPMIQTLDIETPRVIEKTINLEVIMQFDTLNNDQQKWINDLQEY